MEKEEVFSIMGKYYGNAYYKSANLTPEDALVITKALDEINVLGYNFSNLHAVEKNLRSENCQDNHKPLQRIFASNQYRIKGGAVKLFVKKAVSFGCSVFTEPV